MGPDTPGQGRVGSKEINNRRGKASKDLKAPVKRGATAGFASNKMRGRGKIMGKNRY